MLPKLKNLFSINQLTLVFVFIMIISQSCNVHVEKRRYRKGYYVEISKKPKTDISVSENRTTDKIDPIQTRPTKIVVNQSVSIDSIKPINHTNTPKKFLQRNTLKKKIAPSRVVKKHGDDPCDIIHMKDGTTVEAKVVQISDTEIRYKKCNFEEGPTFTISPSKVQSIDLKNGDIYTPSTNTNNAGSGEVTGGMIATMVLAGIALLCLIIAMIMIIGYSGFSGLIAAIPLAIAGITSLVGLIMGTRFLNKEAHGLGKAGFFVNLVLQVLAIIFTVLMFFI